MKDDWFNMEIPFQEDSPSTYYSYRCQKCGYSEEVEDFIADEFGFDEDTSTWSMPTIACPECGGIMVYHETEKAEG